MTSWPMKHKIKVPMQTDGYSCGLWLLNYMEYWTRSTLSDHVTQEDISNFRFKLPAILYNSLLNEIRGLPDKEQKTKTGDDLDELVEELNDLDILMSGNTKLTRTLKWTNREDLLTTICGLFHLIANDETLEKEWIRSTRPYPISLSLRQIINILDDDRQPEHETFNMAIRMVACNQDIAQKKQIFHYMDLKFVEITHFGRDPRCCPKIDKAYQDQLKKVFECWPEKQYDIKECSNILLPYYQDGLYTLFIIDMQKIIVHIMDPLQDHVCLKGYDHRDSYIPTLHTIARRFNLAMGLLNYKMNDNIYHWKREYPTCVTKVTHNKHRNLGGFLVYSFMKSWDGIRLPPINNLPTSLRREFLADILTSNAKECSDNIPDYLQYMIKELGRI
ncbi:uncharacterized protein [Miscanthus floridulus]|uniref:uncharacterized protein n=1 Tax=Miscanthus floridulus TaxID=154761 RepID=UPI00345AE7F9